MAVGSAGRPWSSAVAVTRGQGLGTGRGATRAAVGHAILRLWRERSPRSAVRWHRGTRVKRGTKGNGKK